MFLVFEKLALLEAAEVDNLLWDCDETSRKITNFSRTSDNDLDCRLPLNCLLSFAGGFRRVLSALGRLLFAAFLHCA